METKKPKRIMDKRSIEKRECNHKPTLPLYARGEKSWESTQKLTGQMVYVCKKCGSILTKEMVKIDVLCEGGEK